MSQSQSDTLTISKRRLMLYKAVKEFPDNKRIRSALLRTYAAEHIQVAARAGVYIGYNRADELFAVELDTPLRQAEVNVWLDQIDVEPDEDWQYAVSNAMNRSGVMLLVLSSQSITDEQLLQEARAFLESGKVVIPVKCEAIDTTDLDLIMPPVDFSIDFETGLQFLLRGLIGQSAVNV